VECADFCFANLAGLNHDWPMIPRMTFASVLCAVLFGAFGQVAASAADGGGMVATTNTGGLNDTNSRVQLHALEQRSGVEKLAEPEVVSTVGVGANRMSGDTIETIVQRLNSTNYTTATTNGSQPAGLVTRVFKVDTHSFYAALKNVPGFQTNLVSTNAISLKSVSSVLGVDLTAPGRGVAFKDTLGLLMVKATPSELDTIQRALDVLNKAAPQVHIKTRFIKMSEADADAILKAGTAVDTNEKNTVEIMTAAKATPLLRKLESRTGMETLGEPEATMASLRQIQMHSGNSTVDISPALLADGLTINLTATVSVPETLAAQANVWDNQTLILASNNPGTDNTRLLVFITATVVDPAGNRVHSDDKLPFNPSAIPPQHTLITTPSP
jgi:hypothetical protein